MNEIQQLSTVLFPKNHATVCRVTYCCDTVAEFNGRFFITFGHAGFNSPTNNGAGYRTSARAMAASTRYANRGRKN
jgi:hypothetical protein